VWTGRIGLCDFRRGVPCGRDSGDEQTGGAGEAAAFVCARVGWCLFQREGVAELETFRHWPDIIRIPL